MASKYHKRVLLFLPRLGHGGVPVAMTGLANELARRGHQVEVVVLARGALEHRLSPKVGLVNLACSRALMALLPLWRHLRKSKPDVLISALFQINTVAITATLLLPGSNTRIIASQRSAMRSSARESDRWIDRATPWLAKVVYRFPRYLVCVSEGVRSEMIQSVGVCPRRAVTIYNPIITPATIAQSEETQPLPAFGQIGDPIIASLGRLTMQKDVPTLLHAFKILRQARPGRLLILGDGPERGRLERLARDLNLEQSVYFAGFVDKPLGYLRQAQLFVLSSIYEGFGNVLPEALLCGLPIVSTDCDFGPKEILGDGKWGTLVPIRDPAALAEAMGNSLDNPPSAQKQRQRALHFTDQKSADRYEALLSE